jgi:hypothetical protein
VRVELDEEAAASSVCRFVLAEAEAEQITRRESTRRAVETRGIAQAIAIDEQVRA